MLVSYAQNFEDVILWRALGHVPNGFYVDVGAQDPVDDSVSLAFYERGWRGIHVEPCEQFARRLREARPDELVVEAAADAEPGTIAFFEIPGSGLSTADETTARRHAGSGHEVVEKNVPRVTLDEVFSRRGAGDIHWLKIDVEGLEDRVLAGWRNGAVRPWVVVVESTLPQKPDANHQQWEPGLLARDYRFALFDGLNRYYVAREREDLLPAFSCGANVFDGFTLSGTASSTLCTRLKARIQALEEQTRRQETALEAGRQALAGHERSIARAHVQIERGLRQLWQLRQQQEGRDAPAGDRPASIVEPKDLLALRGRRFVDQAYRTLLLREPEASGVLGYLELLRHGASKIEVIRRIRYSREGRSAGVDMQGLRVQLALARFTRVPLIGHLIRLVVALAARPGRNAERRRARLLDALAQLDTEWEQARELLAGDRRDAGDRYAAVPAAGGAARAGERAFQGDTQRVYESLKAAVRGRRN